jgi:hypothetical protein
MKLKVLLCELIKNANPQESYSSEVLKSNSPTELIGYGVQMGHYWRLGSVDNSNEFYIEDFGDFHHSGRINIDSITNIKAWNEIWNSVYYNHEGKRIILNISYEDNQFDFSDYNKFSKENGESILKRIEEM